MMRNIVLVWLLARFNSGRAITSAKVYNEIEQERVETKMLIYTYVGVWSRLKLEGVAQFSLSPGKAPAVAVFIPEKNVSL